MGIPGLLPLLKDITNKRHIKDFAGKRAAIDGYGWLYKGAYSCAREICEDVPTDKCATCGAARHTHLSSSALYPWAPSAALTQRARSQQALLRASSRTRAVQVCQVLHVPHPDAAAPRRHPDRRLRRRQAAREGVHRSGAPEVRS